MSKSEGGVSGLFTRYNDITSRQTATVFPETRLWRRRRHRNSDSGLFCGGWRGTSRFSWLARLAVTSICQSNLKSGPDSDPYRGGRATKLTLEVRRAPFDIGAFRKPFLEAIRTNNPLRDPWSGCQNRFGRPWGVFLHPTFWSSSTAGRGRNRTETSWMEIGTTGVYDVEFLTYSCPSCLFRALKWKGTTIMVCKWSTLRLGLTLIMYSSSSVHRHCCAGVYETLTG